MIREFYANLYVDDLDEDFDDCVAKSKLNAVDVYVDEELLLKLFDLSNRGIKCIGADFCKDKHGHTCQI